jgi:beta-lactamase class A
LSLTRLEFVRGCTAALVASSASSAIDWSFPGVVAAYARRLEGGDPFVAHNANVVMPAASVIKVLILLATIRRMERLGCSWSHPLLVRGGDVVGASETFGNARAGQPATIEALARATIEQSDNTAANVLVDWLGFARINRLAAAAQLANTAMRRHFMDFAARAAGIDNTTTARDMATLLYGIGNGTTSGFAGVSSAGCRRIVGFMDRQEDRDTIPAAIHRSVRIANKTGVLSGVRHDVALVGMGSSDAYAVALLSTHAGDEAQAARRLRALAAQIDAASRMENPG